MIAKRNPIFKRSTAIINKGGHTESGGGSKQALYPLCSEIVVVTVEK